MKAKRGLALGALGAAALAALLPRFDAAQPRGLSVTRTQALSIADRAARDWGIPVGDSFPVVTFRENALLEHELASDRSVRRSLDEDPVVGPRLASFRVTYFRRGLEKFPEHGSVFVGKRGELLGVRKRARPEESGAKPDAGSLRPVAERFLADRRIPGAPAAVHDAALPTVLRDRTDHVLRYSVPHAGPPEDVAFFVAVAFIGDDLSGWELQEEYRDGRPFRYGLAGDLAATLGRFAIIFGLLFVLLVIFLRKYHAGEVGVGAGAFLFAAMLALYFAFDLFVARPMSFGTGFGGTDAFGTAAAEAGFKLLFLDLPIALLVFLSWAVGESYARERWGARLASFDALLRRDVWNATVGGSLLTGLLLAPLVAASALVPPLVPVLLGKARPTLGNDVALILASEAGPFTAVLAALLAALPLSVTGILFGLSAFHRRRATALGLLVAAAIGPVVGAALAPVEPLSVQIGLGFGAPLAAAAAFLLSDLLAAAVSLFGATLLLSLLPLLRAVEGAAFREAAAALLLPLVLLLAVSLAGLATRRTVEYRHEDLAPHVKRIVERERVKAEIDAANRIQAALLPPIDPKLPGVVVASHYRAATEIGGDYFDFLALPGGRVGLAFGDVAGHGLTSGIVMAMAKSALLVQTGHDPSPVRVMEVLNETVRKTAPRRMLMTFFFGVLDPATGTLRYCSAGHLDPYVVRNGHGSVEPLSAWGFPLGVKRREAFVEHVARLQPGDRLVLYSDGLIEALDDDGEPFGFSRFESVLRDSARDGTGEIRQALLGAVRRFTRNRPPEDDQTLVVLSIDDRTAAGEAVA